MTATRSPRALAPPPVAPRRTLRTERRRGAAFALTAGLTAALCAACARDEASADEVDAFRFVDVAGAAGIDVVNVSGDPRRWYIPESNGTGAAWLDHDGDGDLDLFVGNGAGMAYHDDGRRLEVLPTGGSRLYRNDGGLAFTDVTEATGAGRHEWINAVTTGDPDGDGDTDLYLACFGPDVYLRNEGGRFVEATAAAGLGNELWGAGAAFADVDRDGDLDLYVANYIAFDCDAPPAGGERCVIEGVEVAWGPEGENKLGYNPGAPDAFFRNRGDGTFEEATAAAGFVLEKALCSFACVFSDVTGDGWPDLLVANDVQPANLFVNLGDGTFREEGVARGFATDAEGKPTSAMGLFVEDVDGDGDVDALRTNFDFEPNSLHLNDGHGHFAERAARHGLAQASVERLGWGGGFFDADCDGDLDLLVANGHVFPQAAEIGMNGWEQPTQLFEAVRGADGALSWRDATAEAGPGLAGRYSARGVALGDPDDDGDLDALVVDLDRRPRLLENRTRRRGRWLGLRLVGAGANPEAIGARVTLHAGPRRWTREVRSTNGLFSAHDVRLHFGLGELDAVERVEVRWPDGTRQTFEAPPLERYTTLRQES